jgi:hypothetical protein
MSTVAPEPTGDRVPTDKWRRLPERIRPEDTVETVPEDRAPAKAATAGDPETAWVLRHA